MSSLTCTSEASVCDCMQNIVMKPEFLNETGSDPGKMYECGYLHSVNGEGFDNCTDLGPFQPNPQFNVSGWYCGGSRNAIFPNTSEYNVNDLYACGYMYGCESKQSVVVNSSTLNMETSKKALLLLVLLVISYFF